MLDQLRKGSCLAMAARRQTVTAQARAAARKPEGDYLTPGKRLALASAILARGAERRAAAQAALQESEPVERKRAA